MPNDERNALDTYLGEIGGSTLLSDDDERRLALRIEQGDSEAQMRLATANLRYVVSVARQYEGRGLSMGDMISEGNIALLDAAEKYRADFGKRFVAFAAPYVRQAIEAAIDSQTGLYRVPRNEASPAEVKRSRPLSVDAPLPEGSQNTFSLLHVVADQSLAPTDDAALTAELSQRLGTALSLLPPLDADILRRCYGIGVTRQTMAEIGQDMGLKRERVRQHRNKALRRLRKVAKGLRTQL